RRNHVDPGRGRHPLHLLPEVSARSCHHRRSRAVAGRRGRRPRRVDVETLGGGEGLGYAHPRPWRVSRSLRLDLLHAAHAVRLLGPDPEPLQQSAHHVRMKSISILGSTGSVGTSTLAVVDAFPDQLRVVALAAGGNLDLLAEQIGRYRPELVSVRSATDVA